MPGSPVSSPVTIAGDENVAAAAGAAAASPAASAAAAIAAKILGPRPRLVILLFTPARLEAGAPMPGLPYPPSTFAAGTLATIGASGRSSPPHRYGGADGTDRAERTRPPASRRRRRRALRRGRRRRALLRGARRSRRRAAAPGDGSRRPDDLLGRWLLRAPRRSRLPGDQVR